MLSRSHGTRGAAGDPVSQVDVSGEERPRRIVAVLGTRYPDLDLEASVLGPLGVELVSAPGRDDEEIAGVAGEAEVIMAGSAPRFGDRVLRRLGCRGIVRYGVGVDSIDLEAAGRRGVWVVHVPDYGTEAVALHAVTLILTGLRRVLQADRALREGAWGFDDLRPVHLPSSLTAGVVGFGRIGRRVGELLDRLGFGTVLAHDPYADLQGVEAVSLEELLGRSDVVTLHAPGGEAPLLDAGMIGRMREGSLLVNTARGSLIDLAALVEGLARARPGFAALDVFPVEPPDPVVFEGVADRVVLTPHMAWYTEETEADLRRRAAEEAARLLRGETPHHAVVRPEAS